MDSRDGQFLVIGTIDGVQWVSHFMDFPYVDRDYEVRQLEVFLEMLEKGSSPLKYVVDERYDLPTIAASLLES